MRASWRLLASCMLLALAVTGVNGCTWQSGNATQNATPSRPTKSTLDWGGKGRPKGHLVLTKTTDFDGGGPTYNPDTGELAYKGDGRWIYLRKGPRVRRVVKGYSQSFSRRGLYYYEEELRPLRLLDPATGGHPGSGPWLPVRWSLRVAERYQCAPCGVLPRTLGHLLRRDGHRKENQDHH